jgi:hypothetical protein
MRQPFGIADTAKQVQTLEVIASKKLTMYSIKLLALIRGVTGALQ